MTTQSDPYFNSKHIKPFDPTHSDTSVYPVQQARQILLNLLGEYREMEMPANPELLKLHIDAATDRLEAIYQGNDLAAPTPLGNLSAANPPKSPPTIDIDDLVNELYEKSVDAYHAFMGTYTDAESDEEAPNRLIDGYINRFTAWRDAAVENAMIAYQAELQADYEADVAKRVVEALQDALTLWSAGETKQFMLDRIADLKAQSGGTK